MRPLIQGVGGFSPEIRRWARTSAADSTQALDFCRHKEEIEILERKFTSSLIVCKRQATVAGEGDRKSNEALDWLPGQWLPHTRLIEWHRMLPSRVRSWSSWHQRWTHFWSNFNLKISCIGQISTFEGYIPPPYIVIGLVIPIILTVIWENQWEGIFLIL